MYIVLQKHINLSVTLFNYFKISTFIFWINMIYNEHWFTSHVQYMYYRVLLSRSSEIIVMHIGSRIYSNWSIIIVKQIQPIFSVFLNLLLIFNPARKKV